MDTNCARSPAAVLGSPRHDPSQRVTPAPHPRRSHIFLDGEKAGTALILSGFCLALIGVTLTVMGWQRYKANTMFEWTQLLGPMLISVGGTFILTSVCKFNLVSCWTCRQWEEEVPVVGQTSARLPGGVNQPIMLHSATTTMLCLPPAYNFVTQDVQQAVDFQPGCSLSAALPPYGAVCCADNAAFSADAADNARSRIERTADEGGRGDESGATCSRPPAYDDIYPSSNKHSVT
ncbi:hypothetical protein JOB18_031021 [Solea senegalensis]|uniref:Transmembrane protein 174 n=1 Tax=Solea senegalensis TaxID=28829 RepID=A0AAV6R101_SOLSE|nr:transmembrane protein 174 [Solea senegalensis]KAG7499166.1 hypothetical protein JOB18_031021 [Solea senegalensis]